MKKRGLIKRILLAALSAAMAFTCFAGMAGCTLFGAGGGEGEITIWAGTYWGGDNKPILDAMVEKYNDYARLNGKPLAKKPEIQQDMRASMTTGAISGRIADVIIWDRWESLRLANQEVFLALDDRLTAAGHTADEFNTAAMNETKYNGKHYGLPLDLDTWGLFVNRNVYLNWAKSVTDQNTLKWLVNEGKTDESTVGEENSKFNYPKDWNEFHTAALGCTDKNPDGSIRNRAGMSVDAEFVAWVSTAGGEVADVEAGKVVLHSNTPIPNDPLGRTYRQATESVLQHLDRLIYQDTDTAEEKKDAVTSFTFMSNAGTVDHFLTEKVAFKTNSILNGMTTYNKYKTDTFDFDFIPFPSAPGLDKRGGMLGGYSMAIPQRAPHIDAAWELMEWWILNDENYEMWSEMSNLIPARTSVMEAVRADEEHMNAAPYLKTAIDCIGNYKTRPPHIAYSLYESNVQSPSLDVYLRRQTQGASGEATLFHMNEFFKKIERDSDLAHFLGVQ